MEIEDDIDRRTKPNDVDNLDDLTDNKVHRRLGVRTIIDHEATSNSKFDIEQDSLYEQNNENHNLVDEFKDRKSDKTCKEQLIKSDVIENVCSKAIQISKHPISQGAITFLLLLQGNYFYFNSLISCPIEPYNLILCFEWFQKIEIGIVTDIVLSSLWFSIIILLVSKKYFRWYWLVITLINLVWLYIYQSGGDFKNHGSINRLALIAFILINFILYFIAKCTLFIFMKGKTAVLTLLSLTIIIILLLYIVFAKDSCKGWRDGLHGAKLEDIEGVCTIPIPNYCELKLREGLLDFNRYGVKCNEKTMKFKTEYLNDYLKSRTNLKRIGFPRVDNLTNEERLIERTMRAFTKKNLVDMDDPS